MRSTLISVLVLMASACASSSGTTVSPGAAATTTTRIGTAEGRTVGVATTTGGEEMSATLQVPVERTWELLPLAYADLEIPVRLQQQGTRTIGNTDFRVRRVIGGERASRYLNCGSASGGPNADTYQLTINIVTQAREAANDASTVTTRLTATAKSPNYAGAVATCSTTGRLERRIADMVAELARRGE